MPRRLLRRSGLAAQSSSFQNSPVECAPSLGSMNWSVRAFCSSLALILLLGRNPPPSAPPAAAYFLPSLLILPLIACFRQLPLCLPGSKLPTPATRLIQRSTLDLTPRGCPLLVPELCLQPPSPRAHSLLPQHTT